MSREIQISTNSAAAADFWTQGAGSAMIPVTANVQQPPVQSPAGPPRSAARKAHRLLRGRYPLAILLAAIGATAGAIGGYSSVPPKWQSTGIVLINPMLVNDNSMPGQLPMPGQFQQVEQGLLSSSPVINQAIHSEEFGKAWKQAYGTRPLPSEADFTASVDVAHSKGDGLIRASFDDQNKEVAFAGSNALFHAFMSQHGSIDDLYHQDEILVHDKKVQAELSNQIAALQDQERALGTKYGTEDLGPRDEFLQQQLGRLEEDLKATTLAYSAAIAVQQGTKKAEPIDMENLYMQIARLPDRMMLELLETRRANRKNMEDVQAVYGTKHIAYQTAARNLRDSELAVDDYAKNFLKTSPQLLPQYNDPTATNIASLKDRVTALQQTLDQTKAAANEIDQQKQAINEVKNKIASTQTRYDAITKTIDTINTERELSKNIKLETAGSEPVIDDKKRKIAAGAGILFGGLIPVGLLMLYGLTENRFRYSDDANATDLSGVTLLGILPNLPDRLSDPQQAGVAAHCVHQIRTMLQISRSNDEPQVIAVTSAAPGDGKTSLTLALGLSYAACGARTLLVDCDLIAAGLTHRLNVSSPDGVLEAVANRALLEYVRTTDIADVAILPVGTTHAHHASTLSPVALRRLLSEAKKQFDIVIVDTGPILGSIEASLVCAAADRTILTVARNQQRPLVERSIGHLQSIGSNLAGVVFNRAQARDFEKSMNGLALRSRPPAPSGATAKAVAGSFKRAG